MGGLAYGQALILGLLQGMTEFLPVSSSGHLVLAREFLGLSLPGLRLEIVLHLGTALAVVVLFRRDFGALAVALFGGRSRGGGRALIWRLLVATLPAVVVGLACRGFIEQRFTGPRTAAAFLLVTAAALFAADRIRPGRTKAEALPLLPALLVGLAQAVAILPGISRSGATVGAGLAAGLERGEAARFSLLLAVPVIAGGAVADLFDLGSGTLAGTASLPVGPVLVGLGAAFLSGLAAALLLLAAVRRSRLGWFAGYCAVAGVTALLVL